MKLVLLKKGRKPDQVSWKIIKRSSDNRLQSVNKEIKSLTRCDNVVDAAQGAPRVIFGLSYAFCNRVIQKPRTELKFA